MDEENRFSRSSRLVRYFLHGMAFSILFVPLAFVWVFIFLALIVLGSFIGLIIGFLALFFMMGGLNTLLTGFIWSVDVRSNWKTLFIHGLALGLALVIVELPSYFIARAAENLLVSIALFVFYSFINGLIAKNIGFVWKEEYSPLLPGTILGPKEPSSHEPHIDDLDADRLYNKLLVKYVNHWGTGTGIELLNEEIRAYTRHGETFAEAVRKVHERQQPDR